jgi:tetratricopeptide (TPR) repeat protein
VKLVDGSSGAEIEKKSFTAPAKQALAIRDSLTNEVSDFLRTRLGTEIKLRTERAATTSTDAWVLVQRADQARRRAEGLAADDSASTADRVFVEADSLLTAARRVDGRWLEPTVQRAWIAYRRALAGARGGEMEPEDVARHVQRAVAHADSALQRDPQHARALEVRGTARYLLYVAPNVVDDERARHAALDSAEADLVASTSRDPKNASAWATLSHLYSRKPDFAQAKLAALNAYEKDAYLSRASDILDRLYQSSYLTETFVDARRWCAEGYRRFPRDPRFIDCQIWLLTLDKVAPTPDPDSAWRLLDSLEARLPQGAGALQRRTARIPVAIVLGRAKLADSAKRVLERNRDETGSIDKQGDLLSYEAYARLTLGDRDGAIKLLERYVTAHPDHREGWRKDSAWWWRTLEGDPRFERMMAGSNR